MKVKGSPFTGTERKNTLILLLLVIAAAAAITVFLGFRIGVWKQHEDTTEFVKLVSDLDDYEGDGSNTVLLEEKLVDSRCADELEAMMTACRNAGGSPVICSAFISAETQQEIEERLIASITEGDEVDAEDAETIAKQFSDPSGNGEQRLGTVVDIFESGILKRTGLYFLQTDAVGFAEGLFRNYDEIFEASVSGTTYAWLLENSWQYGFILRYPEGAEDITGVSFSPWRFRYVGTEAATQMHELGLTLEEYNELFYS